MNYIIGGRGFVGTHIVKKIGATVLELDLRENPVGTLDMLHSGDIVFHAAHFGSVDECAKNSEDTRAVNVDGTIRFFDEVKKRDAIPVYFSTNMVFDGDKAFNSESEAPRPITEYGKQKRGVEEYITSLFPKYLIIRMTKVYGPGSESFVESWLQLLAQRKPIRAAEDIYAAPVFIQDVMASLHDVLQAGYSGVCHIGGPIERRMDEIAELIVDHAGSGGNSIARIRIHDLGLVEKRSIHNSLACDTLSTRGYYKPRDLPEILREFYS